MGSTSLLLLRIVFGSLVALHGFPKLFGGAGKPLSPAAREFLGPNFTQAYEQGGLSAHTAMVERMGLPVPAALATLSGGAEFFGGLAVALGFQTRLAALLLVGNMAVAIRKVHWGAGLIGPGSKELPLLFLTGFLTLAMNGPGAFSLDRLLHPPAATESTEIKAG